MNTTLKAQPAPRTSVAIETGTALTRSAPMLEDRADRPMHQVDRQRAREMTRAPKIKMPLPWAYQQRAATLPPMEREVMPLEPELESFPYRLTRLMSGQNLGLAIGAVAGGGAIYTLQLLGIDAPLVYAMAIPLASWALEKTAFPVVTSVEKWWQGQEVSLANVYSLENVKESDLDVDVVLHDPPYIASSFTTLTLYNYLNPEASEAALLAINGGCYFLCAMMAVALAPHVMPKVRENVLDPYIWGPLENFVSK